MGTVAGLTLSAAEVHVGGSNAAPHGFAGRFHRRGANLDEATRLPYPAALQGFLAAGGCDRAAQKEDNMFTRVAAEKDLREETLYKFEVGRRLVTVALVGGKVRAFDDSCPHEGC